MCVYTNQSNRAVMNTQHLLIQKSRLLAQHTQESTQRSPDPFPCERVGSGLHERAGSERVGPGHKTSFFSVCIICHLS